MNIMASSEGVSKQEDNSDDTAQADSAEKQAAEAEERKSLDDFIKEVLDRLDTRNSLREANVKAQENRPDESFFFKLDSNLKKNTAFVKKLKNLTEAQKDSLIKDINSLNLTKYIGEAAAALTEAKLKMSDIHCAVVVCSLLHQRYADFSSTLLENWNKILLSKKDDKVHNASKLRVDLRFFADLVSAGVFTEREGLPVLANQLMLLTVNDKEEHNNLPIIISFCKHCGDDYAGLVPQKFRILAEKYGVQIPRSELLRADRQRACRNLLKDYYTSLHKHILSECKEVRDLEQHSHRIMQTKGELSAERKERLETAQQSFQKLYQNCLALADLLEEPAPELPKEEVRRDTDGTNLNIFTPMRGSENLMESLDGLFEDEDTRQFYETLPDLKAIIPGILYKDSEHAEATIPAASSTILDDDGIEEPELQASESQHVVTADSSGDQLTEGAVAADNIAESSADISLAADAAAAGETVEVTTTTAESTEVVTTAAAVTATSAAVTTDATAATVLSTSAGNTKSSESLSTSTKVADNAKQDTLGTKKKAEDEQEFEATSVIPEFEEEEGDTNSSMKIQLEAFLNNLPRCVNRELIDSAAIEFCMHYNTKINRRKLVRALFFVYRTRYDLLPFYARLVAILHPCMPSVAVDLALMLKGDFKYHVKKKNQMNIESKLKTVRFIGELVKFRMFDKAEALQCIKMLMSDFVHHNIEMACALLETCGRYLYRSAESHHRTKVYLDVMMRKKQALHLDSRYSTMIENAFYYSNPPDSKIEQRKVRPPVHEYIRKLLYKDLSKVNIERILKQMRKLNWKDPEMMSYTIKRLTSVWNVRYSSIHCVANLLAGLVPYHEDVGIQVVDSVLEDIRLGLEVNHPRYNQRRVSVVKFLGELYNYKLVESGLIFSTLYSFITFGVNMDDASPSPLDPPEHLFRIRLICVLLDSCGQYFDRGSSKAKLDCFLVYFQRYYWHKKRNAIWNEDRPFPMDVEYMVYDTLEALRPKLKICESWEEASSMAVQQDKELEKFAEKFAAEAVKESDTAGGLSSIKESDECDLNTQGTCESDDEGTGQSQSQKDDDEYDDVDNINARHRSNDNEAMDSAGDEDNDEVTTGEQLSEEEDGQVKILNGGMKHIKCAEDDDFLAAFDKLMSETMQMRIQESNKVPVVDISVPVGIKSQKVKPSPAPVLNILSGTSSNQDVGDGEREEKSQEEENEAVADSIPFTVMSRKGNKQQFTTLNIPLTEIIASKYHEQKEAVKAEKERIKKVVLDIHQRQEEEDYQEMLAQLNRPLASSNTGRERKAPQFHHQKGVPDTDSIFGSGPAGGKFTKR